MTEIIFMIENAPEGGYSAKALGASIFTQAETLEELRSHLREAVLCHFEPELMPRLIRLHCAHDEVMAVWANRAMMCLGH